MGASLDALLLQGVSGRTAYKQPARAVAIANITLQALQTIDGVALAEGDRVLLTAQTNGAQNGIYIAGAGVWARATDLAEDKHAQLGMLVPVIEGTTYAQSFWVLTAPASGTIRLGTTALTWTPSVVGTSVAISGATPQVLGTLAASAGSTGAASDAGHIHTIDATSAATANKISKRDGSGGIQYATVNCTAAIANTAVETPLLGVDTIQEGPGAANVAIGSSSGAVNITSAVGGSVTATTGTLGLSALAGALNVSASTTCAIQATDVELSGDNVLITPSTECHVDGRFKASSTFVANSEGVCIGPSAVAPGATQNGAIQLHTAAPTGNPADVNKAWIWLDGGNGIDTRDTAGNRLFVNVQSVICDTGVLAAVTVATPQVSYNVDVGLDVELVHGTGGKFDFKRGINSYAQLTSDGTTTTLEETGSNLFEIKASEKITLWSATALAQYQSGREWWTMAENSPDWTWTIDPDSGGIATIDCTEALRFSCGADFSEVLSGSGAKRTENFSSTGWISERKTYSATITNPATSAVISLADVDASSAYGYEIEVLVRVTAGSTAYSRVLRTTLHTAIRRGAAGNAAIETTSETGPNRSNASYSATVALSTNTPQVTVTIASGDSAAVLVRVERTVMP